LGAGLADYPFGELSDQIGKTTAVASPLGVSLEEVAAATSLMTRNGIGAEETFTQINAVMSSMLKPSSEAAKLAESLGLQWNAAGLKANGLAGSMTQLIQKTGGSHEKKAEAPAKKTYTAAEKTACSIEAMRNGGECEACQ